MIETRIITDLDEIRSIYNNRPETYEGLPVIGMNLVFPANPKEPIRLEVKVEIIQNG